MLRGKSRHSHHIQDDNGITSARGWDGQTLSESHLAQICVEAEQGSDMPQNTMLCRA